MAKSEAKATAKPEKMEYKEEEMEEKMEEAPEKDSAVKALPDEGFFFRKTTEAPEIEDAKKADDDMKKADFSPAVIDARLNGTIVPKGIGPIAKNVTNLSDAGK